MTIDNNYSDFDTGAGGLLDIYGTVTTTGSHSFLAVYTGGTAVIETGASIVTSTTTYTPGTYNGPYSFA
jgi:hypothetical protein